MRFAILATSVVAVLTVGGSGLASRWTTPGSLLFIHGFPTGKLKLIRADGRGRAITLTRPPVGPAVTFRWSPAGKKIVYWHSRGRLSDIRVMRADGEKNLLIARRGAQPEWAPDGARIAYARDSEVSPGIETTGLTGRGTKRLTRGQDDGPTWSPDGKQIAFHHVISDVADEVWVMNSDGTARKRLAGGVGDNALDPAWSPDGETIAFIREVGNSAITSKVFLMKRDGTEQRSLTGNPTSGLDELEPAWSPDGGKLAFIHERSGLGAELHVINADGSGERTLARRIMGGWGSGPMWSPDGNRVAFVGLTQNGDAEIYLINADGSKKRRLTRSAGPDIRPVWRPR